MGNFESKIFEQAENEEKQNPLEKAMDKFSFLTKDNEEFSSKDLRELARLEGYYSVHKKRLEWGKTSEEIKRCELRKKIETMLLAKKPEEIVKFWKDNLNEYCDNFGRARGEEGKRNFELLKHGILNELIANRIFGKIPGFQVRITNSEIDIDNGIDLLVFSSEDEKTILAIQVKTKSRKDMKIEKEKVIQEIGAGSVISPEKKKFFNGCLDLEKKIKNDENLKDQEIKFKNLWVIIPSEDKIGEGGEFNEKLKKEFEKGFEEILGKN